MKKFVINWINKVLTSLHKESCGKLNLDKRSQWDTSFLLVCIMSRWHVGKHQYIKIRNLGWRSEPRLYFVCDRRSVGDNWLRQIEPLNTKSIVIVTTPDQLRGIDPKSSIIVVHDLAHLNHDWYRIREILDTYRIIGDL